MRATTLPTVMPKSSCRDGLLTDRVIIRQMMTVQLVIMIGE